MMRIATPDDHLAISILLNTVADDAGPALLLAERRARGEIALELITEGEQGIRSHLAFVHLASPEGFWQVHRPTVRTARQGQGFGKESMYLALQEAQRAGAKAVVAIGDLDYFTSFGFSALAAENLTTSVPMGDITMYPIAPESGRISAELRLPELAPAEA